LLPSVGVRLITAAGQKRPKQPHSMIVAFEHLSQAVAELACGLLSRFVPYRKSFFAGFAELEAYGEIDVRFGWDNDLLIRRTTIQRTRICVDVQSVLRRRCQEICKITCTLRIMHEPPAFGRLPLSGQSTHQAA